MTEALSLKTLKGKLITSYLLMGLVPLILIGVIPYLDSRKALGSQRGIELQSIAEQTIDKIDRNLFERYGDVQAFALHPAARGSREEIEKIANNFTSLYGIYDLMEVIDLSGTVIATNTINFAGEAIKGRSSVGSSVAREDWFDKIINGGLKKGETYYSEVKIEPRVNGVNGGTSMMLHFAAPVYDDDGKIIRIWSNYASWDRIVVQILESLSQSFEEKNQKGREVLLISKDGTILYDKDPAVILKSNALEMKLRAAQELVSGNRGYLEEMHRRKQVDQISGYAASKGALGFPGYGWGVIVRQDATDAYSSATRTRDLVLVLSALVSVAIVIVALVISRHIAFPLHQTVSVLEKLSEGDLTSNLPTDSYEETAKMARAYNNAVDEIHTTVAAIREDADELTAAAANLKVLSEEMGYSATQSATRSQEVAISANEVSKGVESVAAGIEQMNASINEISRSASGAAHSATRAVESSRGAHDVMVKLEEASLAISKIVKTITKIAEQTNLLALNATIEAARAGDAGKGFAVVAGEVKELAKETASASEDIINMIESVQGNTREAISAIEGIQEVVEQVNELSATIASAVEEQSATVREITHNISSAAHGAEGIAKTIANIAKDAKNAEGAATTTHSSAEALSQMAFTMRSLIGKFRTRDDTDGGPNRKSDGSAFTISRFEDRA